MMPQLPARLLADAVVALHAAFILFVIAGGLLAAWRPRIAALHVPAVAWGAWIEFSGAICPLTPLENALRRAAGEAGYVGGFVEHYVIPIIYPAGLTARVQLVLGGIVVALNIAVYAWLWKRGSLSRAR